ncbi:MAG: co-chaperone DjlA [Gammaproteobacteria bacterium]|nr:co-chaperone DjlA [Gammaproteobacteria bacterium]
MTSWGKIIGAILGYMVWGFFGALMGLIIGHWFDRGLQRARGYAIPGAADPHHVQEIFFKTSFQVMGHLAKADGRVSEAEIAMANQVMQQMRLDETQQVRAREFFREGKADDYDLDFALDQLKYVIWRRSNLIAMFLEIQIATALADGKIEESERDILTKIGLRLGLSPFEINRILKMVEAQQHYGRGQDRSAPSIDDAYQVLGVDKEASDGEVKRAYRKLINQHHPDKLVSKGLPEEMMEMAKEKTQEIQKAYEQVMKTRGK